MVINTGVYPGHRKHMMEKITDKIAALPPDAHYFSLEFFPPKTTMVWLSAPEKVLRVDL